MTVTTIVDQNRIAWLGTPGQSSHGYNNAIPGRFCVDENLGILFSKSVFSDQSFPQLSGTIYGRQKVKIRIPVVVNSNGQKVKDAHFHIFATHRNHRTSALCKGWDVHSNDEDPDCNSYDHSHSLFPPTLEQPMRYL